MANQKSALANPEPTKGRKTKATTPVPKGEEKVVGATGTKIRIVRN